MVLGPRFHLHDTRTGLVCVTALDIKSRRQDLNLRFYFYIGGGTINCKKRQKTLRGPSGEKNIKIRLTLGKHAIR